MRQFWEAFWPNLASTVLGIVIGLPVALWLNRRGTQEADVQRRRAERASVSHVLEILALAIAENRKRLQRFAAVLAEHQSLYDTGLDSGAWEALQSGLTAELRDPELRQKLAYHFARTEALKKLNDTYLKFCVGVESSMSSAPEVKKALGTAIPQAVEELLQETESLTAAIRAARERLANGTPPMLTA